MLRILVLVSVCCLYSSAGVAASATTGPVPLENPIPGKIAKGDIVVKAIDFVRAPKTVDPHQRPTTLAGIATLGSSNAHARIQYMLPIRDGSGQLIVSDLRGVLYITNSSGARLSTYLDLRKEAPDLAGGIFPNEAGLLGFAFHPDFGKTNAPGYGKFYTGYSATSASGSADYLQDNATSHKSVLREWTTADPTADSFIGTSREILRVGQFAQNHNIGTLAFNPFTGEGSSDYGKLYICMGDGGSAYDPNNYGQSLSEPLGAILRIDPLGGDNKRGYAIPQDNPFVGRNAIAPEIWAYGLRHPQHFSFDTDGYMFINDIGQNHVEEVNIGVSGGNYGWRLREGTFATGYGVGLGVSGFVFERAPSSDSFVYPVAQYDHDEGNAIGSGFVYRGSEIAELYGKYVAADIVRGRLFYFDVDELKAGDPAELKELRISIDGEERELLEAVGYENTYAPGFNRVDLRLGIDAEGELYLLTKGDGWIRKLVPAS